MNNLFSHSAIVLPVEDVEKTAAFYRDQLGFEITFTWESPASYAVLKRDEAVGIHLVKRQDEGQPSEKHTALYIFVHDVDTVYREYLSKGVEILHELSDQEYGMREFGIRDINGYILTLGTNLERVDR